MLLLEKNLGIDQKLNNLLISQKFNDTRINGSHLILHV